MVSDRQDLLRKAAELVARARVAENSQKAADLIKQAADILEAVANSSPSRIRSLRPTRAGRPVSRLRQTR